MKPSVMTMPLLPPHLATRSGIREVYRQIKGAGVDSVDVSTADLGVADLAEIKEALAEAGLSVASFIRFIHAPLPGADPQPALAEACEGVDIARALGTDIFMYAPAGFADSIAGHTATEIAERMAADLRPVVDYGNAHGIRVAVEDAPHPDLPICRSTDMRALLDAVPGLWLVYDTANMVLGGDDPIAFLDAVRDRVIHVHLKDIGPAGDGDEWVDEDLNGRPLSSKRHGTGEINLPAIMRELKAVGYDSFISLELPLLREGDRPGAVVADAAEYLTGL